MMLVNQVLTITALLLVTFAVAEKPTTIDESSVSTKDTVPEGSGSFPQPLDWGLTMHAVKSTQTPTKVYKNEPLEESQTTSIEHEESADETNDYKSEENSDRNERAKRKVIFGGGSYGHGGRRTSASGGDPYGRRRGHYGPNNGPQESWPYRRPDIPYVDTPMRGTSLSQSSQAKIDPKAPISTIPTVNPDSPLYKGKNSALANSKKGTTGKQKSPKKTLTKDVKWEIAKFAIQHGKFQAATQFEEILGRKLPQRKIEKFVKRYQKQQKKEKGYGL